MPWRAVGSAMMGVLVGIGLARFAYSPLLPVLIARGWFAPGAAAYLGAANLLGYLAGALSARAAGVRFGTKPVPCAPPCWSPAISLAACSVPLPFLWFFVWRLGIRHRRWPADDPGTILRHGACRAGAARAWPAD